MAHCSVCKSETELFDSGSPICLACDNKKSSRGKRMARNEREFEMDGAASETEESPPTLKG